MIKSFYLAAAFLGMALSAAHAQFSVPAVKANPETLFRNQCATCHSMTAGGPARQGPTLAGVIGRKAGTVPGFKYSAGFSQVNFTWDEEKLDAYLTNPQAVVPGAVMPYRQANATIRSAIIGYLNQPPTEAPQ